MSVANDRPIRVLHAAAGNLYGGVETLLRTLAELRDVTPGVEPEYAVCFEGRLSGELRERGVPVHQLGEVRFSRPWTPWKARRRLASVLRGRKIDALVVHGCWPHLLCARVARRMGIPLVFWMHDLAEGTHWIERGAREVVPDLALVNSRYTATTLPKLFPKVRSEVLYIPVPAAKVDRQEARRTIRAELGTPADDAVIVVASRLEAWKGHGLLVEALGKLAGSPGWTAWVAGGAQRPHEEAFLAMLRERVEALGISGRVQFLGHRGDVPRLFAAADVHCQPNAGPEPFGIAYVEALQAGLPVVSTDMGGAAEIVEPGCGRLVPPGDAEALARTLGGLIEDRALRERLGARGPGRANALCAPGAVLPRLETLLRGLVGDGTSAEAPLSLSAVNP